MSIDFSSTVVVPDHVLARQLDDEIVILNLDSESYFGLDEVGTDLWVGLVAGPTIEDAYQQVLGVYDVDPETLRKDVEALVQQLLDQRLIELRAIKS